MSNTTNNHIVVGINRWGENSTDGRCVSDLQITTGPDFDNAVHDECVGDYHCHGVMQPDGSVEVAYPAGPECEDPDWVAKPRRYPSVAAFLAAVQAFGDILVEYDDEEWAVIEWIAAENARMKALQ